MAAVGGAAERKMKLKLLVDIIAKKVVFAECGNDFVDFLFSLLSLPVGRMIEIISKESMVGSLGNIYQSMGDLKPSGSKPFGNKSSSFSPITNPPLLSPQSSPAAASSFFAQGFSSEGGSGGGLVKEQTSFIVMDDLKVSRSSVSVVSGVTLLKELGRRDLGALVEKEVEFGNLEALELLKASLHSKQVLTYLFFVRGWALRS